MSAADVDAPFPHRSPDHRKDRARRAEARAWCCWASHPRRDPGRAVGPQHRRVLRVNVDHGALDITLYRDDLMQKPPRPLEAPPSRPAASTTRW
ncbi:putative bifunctional protein pyrR [Mycobacterium xenopi 4042]|uniref:Putative bifunctional protein pyrR n=1 Tax=Mycobacterium xenopi 4042 TaxID=1299334 RepID=X7YRP5_MYCXE|nr:putative bifunctional protein pyrR [Mycobacterium xenopi 4042]